jgi:hypothetical protein
MAQVYSSSFNDEHDERQYPPQCYQGDHTRNVQIEVVLYIGLKKS